MAENEDYGIGRVGDSMKQVINRRTAKNIAILIGMNLVFIMLAVGFAVLHHIYHQGWMLSMYVTFLTISYHFSMTALFLVVFGEQWKNVKNHTSAVVGVGTSVVCLLVFGAENFLIPAMIAITILLTVLRKKLQVQDTEEGGMKHA